MADAKSSYSFCCQRCLQPLKLDDSFNYIGEHVLAELSLPINANPDVDLESQATSFDHFIPPFKLSDSGNGNNGFMLISDTGETQSLSHRLKVQASLFDMISANSDIDHPLCDECTDSLLDLMDQELKLVQSECNDYNEYLKRLESDENEPSLLCLEKELEDLQNEEERLCADLETLQKEEKATLEQISEQEKESDRIEKESDRYWREYTRYRREILLSENEYSRLEYQLNYTKAQLEKLTKTNVFNATFHIWHAGHFGTINNFRLGRLPSVPVDWSEINAAWGQTVLLLAALARKINLAFKGYKLVPYGNHSYIEDITDNRKLPLYGSGGVNFLLDPKFDSGMVAFLECLQQFKEEVEKGDKSFCLPYRMEKGKIGDSSTGINYSIKIRLNSEEQWTKALKFLLTNLKWGLAWVTSQFEEEEIVKAGQEQA